MTIPRGDDKPETIKWKDEHQKLIYELAEAFDYTYVLDFRKYAPVYDEDFRKKFFLASHMNPMGYILTSKMVISYIDYIIRHNMDDFKQVGFVGTEFHNVGEKW